MEYSPLNGIDEEWERSLWKLMIEAAVVKAISQKELLLQELQVEMVPFPVVSILVIYGQRYLIWILFIICYNLIFYISKKTHQNI